MRLLAILVVAAVYARAETPAYRALESAYQQVRARNWDAAIAFFQQSVSLEPKAAVFKDLAYAYLKAGERLSARDCFEQAMNLAPNDVDTALEFAFLAYETGEPVAARRIFAHWRERGNATAATAFENIDAPLRDGIARWSEAVRLSPDQFSNHEELAKLAEQRDQLALAADHYEAAWKLRPDLRYLLLDLGRVWKAQGRAADSLSALLAASRGAEPRTAERARELMPSRYPFVYEFQAAIALDRQNVELQRELAYLLLAMNRRPEAEKYFDGIVSAAPQDLLSVAQLGFLKLDRSDIDAAKPLLERVLNGSDAELADRARIALRLPRTLVRRTEETPLQVSNEAKVLAEKSLEKGYLKDAYKYLKIAQENDPVDFSVLLKLGWTANILKNDKEAVNWFRMASRSPDSKVAAEAKQAYRNLAASQTKWHLSAWTLPFYSSRWQDTFSYGQVKLDWKLSTNVVRPYVSVRFIGDTRGRAETNSALGPQYMSESSFIVAAGVATRSWKGAIGWFEAGEAICYVHRDIGRQTTPDYRGGIAWSRGWGKSITAEFPGLFAELNADAVFISRFGNDTLAYVQSRSGYTLPDLLPVRLQLYLNMNITADRQRQPWANFIEIGPGIRFRTDSMPHGLTFSVNFVQGQYTIRDGNPYPPKFSDLRAGLWYAWSH